MVGEQRFPLCDLNLTNPFFPSALKVNSHVSPGRKQKTRGERKKLCVDKKRVKEKETEECVVSLRPPG